MNHRILVIGLAVALMAAGCGDDDTVLLELDEEATRVTMSYEQALEVRLDGNPTTGYTWEIASEGVVELVDRSHRPTGDADGSPGITTLVFSPVATGTADLVLIYHRSWEEGVEPLETRTITITVTE
jgi:inhibitor of cysteine peptidase